jgi:signal transduction histidine kinase/CheY-like chemotaxis protein
MNNEQQEQDDVKEAPRESPSLAPRANSHRGWKTMSLGDESEETEARNSYARMMSSHCGSLSKRSCNLIRNQLPILLVSTLVFVLLSGGGIAVCRLYLESDEKENRDEAMDFAIETGAWFASELDRAILPLFSLAQFATELAIFAELPDRIGKAYEPGSLPFLTNEDGSFNPRRNVTGVCDQPELVSRFTQIASAIKLNTGMEGVLHNLQLAPEGVICLLNPMNNTKDFDDGRFLDNTPAWGLDLLNAPFTKYIATESLAKEEVGIAGPMTLNQCPTCGLYFIARLPVKTEKHQITVCGEAQNRWGFATALIHWEALIERNEIHHPLGLNEHFQKNGFEFQLTRTDRIYNDETETYVEDVVVLAESKSFGSKNHDVSTALQTTNNEWVMTVQYDTHHHWESVLVAVSVLVAFFIAFLVYVILIQKQSRTTMLGITMAQEAKVEVERNMTAYFAHELRNPMSAIDSALALMPEDLSEDAKELVGGMQLCTTFMSSVMNNLLDVRKIEEGKMILRMDPLSLKDLVGDVYKMVQPAVHPGVDFLVVAHTDGRDLVLGDVHRLQQILTNLVSNAIKYTLSGSITIVVGWEDDSVRLECQDTGPGIPKDEQETMFKRFTTRGGAPGTGLGLAIVKQMVDLMRGLIRIDSDPTVKPGTNCIVLLPLKLCEEPLKEESISADALPLQEALSILIVDDIKMNRAMLKRRFIKTIAPNCTVAEAATGEEALSICERECFDVIILDQYMEGAGGVLVGTDTAIAMRRSKIASIIVGCSGNDLDDEFRAAGADLVWKKPMPSNSEIIRHLRQKLAAEIKC